ncbi:MobF family relaxase [Zavarzinella formosa]|uniref:MobF family relaxase n=1 Tax=Zavarzinella formosa TaxID=360055 RepID=UPI00031C8415|nr:MobF family relaxase [Zavarzinella formosa]
MLRTRWITNSQAANAYYQTGDYYADSRGDWLGRGAEMLGLRGEATKEDFFSLCDNRDPRTGRPLTTHTRDGRRVGIDLNFNSVKSVGIVRELGGADNRGDDRVEEAHREAVAHTMRHVEADMRGRIRVGGLNEDRVTGNLVAIRISHRDTRINADDAMPDMSLHDHVVVFNATFDPVEGRFKAAQIGPIKHDAPYFEAIYHNRLACNLRELGYGIRRKDKAFEIAGVSDELVRKFSRRRAHIDNVAKTLGISSPAGRDTLGATTRLGKTKEAEADLNGYWVGRLTESERLALTRLTGLKSSECDTREAVRFAIGHLFERNSVVDERRLYEAAIRRGIGSVTPEGVQAEAKRQGLLVRDGEATTREALSEEQRLLEFAREGKGTMFPCGRHPRLEQDADFQSLSAEQRAVCRHVWESHDRVILIRGAAGTGKTRTMRATTAGIGLPVVTLAPSAEASRGILRREGFGEADTVARFLADPAMQANARGGVIWVDEAGVLGTRQTARLFEVAGRCDARVVLQGDRRQHGSVERGATLRVLEEFAGLPVAELRDIRRQRGQYKAAVELLSRGETLKGFDRLEKLGWVRQAEDNEPLVNDYLAALGDGRSVLAVAPTHAEGEEVTAAIRRRLREHGRIGPDDRLVGRLTPLGWTEAEREDPASYDGSEVVRFHHNSGPYKAGERVRATEFRLGRVRPEHFAVYAGDQRPLAVGDVIRITANGRDKSGKHRLNNGGEHTVRGFTPDGDLRLANGWVIDREFGHWTHGYVTTSHAAQGKTVDRVFIAMGGKSLPAISAEQLYVSVSRGREQTAIYTNLVPEQLREAIRRSDLRKSATELTGQTRKSAKVKTRARWREFMRRAGGVLRQWRERTKARLAEISRTREQSYER